MQVARHLTAEQEGTLQAWLKLRAAVLRGEIARALRRTGDDRAIGLANHLGETGSEPVADLESAIEIAEIERDVRELREVEKALARLGDAKYGACADCGEDIPYLRLAANPAATRCTACQVRAERVLDEPV